MSEMPPMDHDSFEELKEAYALNSLSDEERREVERYLAENPSQQAEVDELSSIATLLALAPPEQTPPAGLRRSLMSQVRSEVSAEGVTESGEGHAMGNRRDSRGSRGGWARRLFGVRGIVTAAAAAAIIGLGVWNVALQSEVRDLRNLQMSAYELQGSGEAETVQGKIVKIGEQGGMLVATDLPQLPENKTYEMWSIEEGQNPEPCGVFEADGAVAIVGIDEPMSGAEQFAITVEPEGGSEQPTTEPLVVADLASGT